LDQPGCSEHLTSAGLKRYGVKRQQAIDNGKTFPLNLDVVQNFLVGKFKAGDVVIAPLEGSKGDPSMHAMLCFGSYVKSKGLGKAYALLADGRFSSGRSSLSVDHCSPETKARGALPFPGPARRVSAPCRLQSRAAHFVN